jgi:hypothetical protein
MTIRLHVPSSCANAIARTISGSYRSCGCTISLTSEGLKSYLKSRTSKNYYCNQDIADDRCLLYSKGGILNRRSSSGRLASKVELVVEAMATLV